MYAYIKGELAETNPDHIVIETGGIGYQVFISGQTFEYLPAVGEEIKVYTYLYLREVGDPDNGIAPGTAFEDLPDNWVCPLCGVGKDQFSVES